jgi:uncharacterized membrane protein
LHFPKKEQTIYIIFRMKYSSKKSILTALSLATAAAPSYAFTPAHMTGSGLRTMKRPLATPLWNSMQQQDDDNNIHHHHQDVDLTIEQKRGTKTTAKGTPVLSRFLQENSTQRNKHGAMVASAALAAALSLGPMQADAAMSGGRMGGSSFSAPSTSRSYSAPRGGGGYSSYSRGPSIIAAPVPYFGAPITPFYSPYSYGYGAPGVLAVSRGPSLFSLLVLGGMALALTNAVSSMTRPGGAAASFFEDDRTYDSVLGSGTSVLKVSVALDVTDRDDPNSILNVLERTSTTARTDTRVGIQNLSSQIAVELLRRKSSIAAASSEYKHFRNREKAQREFNSLSVQERSKFEKETISNYGGVDYAGGRSSSGGGGGFQDKATVAVVTLVLAIDGDSTKVPQIRSIADVEDALRKIASDVRVSDCLQGAEILWTPEDRSETLTFRDVVADYPELNSV